MGDYEPESLISKLHPRRIWRWGDGRFGGGGAGRSASQRRQCGGLSRSNVYYGDSAATRLGVTEPNAGSDTPGINIRTERTGDCYIINGQKVFTSRAEHSDLLLLLARTAPFDSNRRADGLSIFLVDMRPAVSQGLQIRPLETMLNHATTELFFDNLEIPAENLIGEEGQGFRYILDGMNVERILIAAECIGDGYWFIDRLHVTLPHERYLTGQLGQIKGYSFPSLRLTLR